MIKGGHDTLRRKVTEAKGARPPLRDADTVGDMFARLLEERLRANLRKPVSIVFQKHRNTTFGEAVATAPQPCVLAFASLKGGAFGGILPLDAPFIFHLIEVITGVDTAVKDIPNRMLTPIDEALSEDFASHVISCFENAVVPSRRKDARGALRFDRFRRSIGLGVGAPDDADMLAFEVAVSLGPDSEPRNLTFSTPFSVLDFYRAEENATKVEPGPPPTSQPSPESLWSKAMTKAANGAELRLVAVMSQLKLSVEDIAALRPGSVVPLPEGVGMDVDMRLHRIGGVAEEPPLCAGALGASSGRRAVKVDEPPDDGFVDRIAPYMLR